MTRLERVIEDVKSIRTLPEKVRPWIYDDNGNIRDDVLCGDVVPFLEELKDYEVNVSDAWIEKFIENEDTKADNTYNWGANINNDINFWWREGNPIVVMMIHRLGDVRGNYTDRFAVKYDGKEEAIYHILFDSEAATQFKDINDRYSADINIFRESYEVYDSKEEETVGEYYELEAKDVLKQIEEGK